MEDRLWEAKVEARPASRWWQSRWERIETWRVDVTSGQPARLADKHDTGCEKGSQTLLPRFGLRNGRDEFVTKGDGTDEEGRGLGLEVLGLNCW